MIKSIIKNLLHESALNSFWFRNLWHSSHYTREKWRQKSLKPKKNVSFFCGTAEWLFDWNSPGSPWEPPRHVRGAESTFPFITFSHSICVADEKKVSVSVYEMNLNESKHFHKSEERVSRWIMYVHSLVYLTSPQNFSRNVMIVFRSIWILFFSCSPLLMLYFYTSFGKVFFYLYGLKNKALTKKELLIVRNLILW